MPSNHLLKDGIKQVLPDFWFIKIGIGMLITA